MIGFPLLLIPLAIYNIFIFLMPGVALNAPAMTLALPSRAGWVVTIALINYVIWSVTGLSPAWGLACHLGKQLGFYVQLTNLGLCATLLIGGIFYGPFAAIKWAVVLVGFNLIPALAAALFAFGKTCG